MLKETVMSAMLLCLQLQLTITFEHIIVILAASGILTLQSSQSFFTLLDGHAVNFALLVFVFV